MILYNLGVDFGMNYSVDLVVALTVLVTLFQVAYYAIRIYSILKR